MHFPSNMSQQILIINGPNLNLLGKRQPDIYGVTSLTDLEKSIKTTFTNITFDFFQSNNEGDIITKIQDFAQRQTTYPKSIIINAGALTHTSVGIRDVLLYAKDIESNLKIAEVHISNIYAREEFRQISYISNIANCVICGCGILGYELAVRWIAQQNS